MCRLFKFLALGFNPKEVSVLNNLLFSSGHADQHCIFISMYIKIASPDAAKGVAW